MSARLHPRQFEPADELLRCEVVPERGGVRICPLGTLDMATAPLLEHELAELRAAGFRRLIVDLRGLRFMDSTGLRLVLRWHAAAQTDGFDLGVVPGAPAIQRVFELTGTLQLVPFVDPG